MRAKQRYEVRLETLERLYSIAEGVIPALIATYPDDVRRQGWAIDEVNHLLKSLDKWAKTIEANNGDE